MREIGSINQRFDVIRKWTRHIDPPQQFYSATRDPDFPVRIQEKSAVRMCQAVSRSACNFCNLRPSQEHRYSVVVRLANSHHEFTLRCSVFANASLVDSFDRHHWRGHCHVFASVRIRKITTPSVLSEKKKQNSGLL